MKHLTEQSSGWTGNGSLSVLMKSGQPVVDLRFLQPISHLPFAHRSCQSMTSLFSSTMSPVKDGTSSLPRRQTSFTKPPLRALYDLLIGPMEGVSLWRGQMQRFIYQNPLSLWESKNRELGDCTWTVVVFTWSSQTVRLGVLGGGNKGSCCWYHF